MKSRSARGTVRPPDPQHVLRRRAPTGRAKIRVIADRADANEPQLEVQGPLANGAKQGASVFSVTETGKMITADAATIGGALGVTGAANIGGALASGAATITGTAHVTGNANLDGDAVIGGDADVTGDVSAVGGVFSGDVSGAGFDPTDSIGGTATPTPAAQKQRLYRELVPLAVCRVDAAGALVWGAGIAATSRTSNGVYTVTLANPASSSTKVAPFASTRVTGYTADADVTSASVITVTTGPSAGGPLDAVFNLVVWGD